MSIFNKVLKKSALYSFLVNFNSLKAQDVEEFLNNKYAPVGDFAFFTLGKFSKGDDGFDYYNGIVNAVFYADDSNHSLHKSTVKCPSVYKINLDKESVIFQEHVFLLIHLVIF